MAHYTVMQELLTKCRSGDANSIEAFVTEVYPWALRFANSMLQDHNLAEDATQEALITAITRLDCLREDAAIFAWLRQILRTKVYRILRKRRELLLEHSELLESATPEPQAEAEAQHLREIIRKSLSQLPDKGRVTIELFYINERSISEVSRSLGIPVGTVKRRLHDARKRLHSIFSRNGLIPDSMLNEDIDGCANTLAIVSCERSNVC